MEDGSSGGGGPGLAPVAAVWSPRLPHFGCDWDDFGDFGDFGVSFVATVSGRYTRRSGPRLSFQGEPLVVLTRGP